MTMTMTFSVEKLIEVLKENKEEHKKIYEEAVEGYWETVVEEIEENLACAKERKKFRTHIVSRMPEDHSQEYERVLKMLEMTTCKEVELTDDQFECYVMDNWHWQQAFLGTSSNYSGLARGKLSKMSG